MNIFQVMGFCAADYNAFIHENIIIPKKARPFLNSWLLILERAGVFRLSSLLLAASFHLGARNIAFLVHKIQVTFLPLDADFRYFFRAASLFLASCHFSG